MLKQGRMLKTQDFSRFSELWISGLMWCCLLANYTALICFRLTVSLCWATRRRPHNDQDWVGKDWNQEAGVLTLSSLTSYAKTQQELNLRRHDQIGFQHLPLLNIKWSNFSQDGKMDKITKWQSSTPRHPPRTKAFLVLCWKQRDKIHFVWVGRS